MNINMCDWITWPYEAAGKVITVNLIDVLMSQVLKEGFSLY